MLRLGEIFKDLLIEYHITVLGHPGGGQTEVGKQRSLKVIFERRKPFLAQPMSDGGFLEVKEARIVLKEAFKRQHNALQVFLVDSLVIKENGRSGGNNDGIINVEHIVICRLDCIGKLKDYTRVDELIIFERYSWHGLIF